MNEAFEHGEGICVAGARGSCVARESTETLAELLLSQQTQTIYVYSLPASQGLGRLRNVQPRCPVTPPSPSCRLPVTFPSPCTRAAHAPCRARPLPLCLLESPAPAPLPATPAAAAPSAAEPPAPAPGGKRHRSGTRHSAGISDRHVTASRSAWNASVTGVEGVGGVDGPVPPCVAPEPTWERTSFVAATVNLRDGVKAAGMRGQASSPQVREAMRRPAACFRPILTCPRRSCLVRCNLLQCAVRPSTRSAKQPHMLPASLSMAQFKSLR